MFFISFFSLFEVFADRLLCGGFYPARCGFPGYLYLIPPVRFQFLLDEVGVLRSLRSFRYGFFVALRSLREFIRHRGPALVFRPFGES